MSIFGATKDTKLEEQVDKHGKGEEQAAGMYAALSYLAKERGLNEVAEVLFKIATDELRHAGLYAVLNGNTNQDIFGVLKKAAPIEKNAVDQLHQFAKYLRDLGLEEAAKQIDATAMDEGNHEEILVNIIEKFSN